MGLIAENLKFLRGQKKLTIAKTGAGLHIPPSTYSSYEYGKAEPDAKMQLAICEFFGISLTDFLTKKLGGNSGEKGFEYKVGKKGSPKGIAKSTPKNAKSIASGMVNDPASEYKADARTIRELQKQINKKEEMVNILQFALKIAQERIIALEKQQKKD